MQKDAQDATRPIPKPNEEITLQMFPAHNIVQVKCSALYPCGRCSICKRIGD